MVIKGYDTSPPIPPPTQVVKVADADSSSRFGCKGIMYPPSRREVVEEALRKHFFASFGITLIHVFVPQVDDSDILCSHGLIYVNEECEAEALQLDGSDMGGGRILQITAYPFADHHLDHVFAQTKGIDQFLQRTLEVSGFDTSLASKDDIKEMVRGLFGTSGCFVLGNGCVLLYLRGQDNIDNALKLSGVSVRGFKIAVDMVLPIDSIDVGIPRPVWLPPAQGNKKTIMATD
ncbi:unnamed protein product [Eruca vesicaria subsp. sativa]|uniref:RRM domain-containing protein n=1 Tax=Eruca vesicaria subsp. sativa TaxID=29727 RepID=A0ABC8KDW2_ERUVS|nr:unnamed protein product [Eruca vesicaria subsp. sativa]